MKLISRKKFIQSEGATCKNWQWSWSFINHDKKIVIFGAWDRNTEDDRCEIFSEKWEFHNNGKRRSGYRQSIEHIQLIENEYYRLMTFPMEFSGVRQDDKGNGPAKIKSFTPVLAEKKLSKIGDTWYAEDLNIYQNIPEELPNDVKYPEGAKKEILINAYERNPQARKKCISHHGTNCSACKMDFESIYGELGKDFIHVHHVIPISQINDDYDIDPVKDLIPLCPNCHAMIHKKKPVLTLQELKKIIKKT